MWGGVLADAESCTAKEERKIGRQAAIPVYPAPKNQAVTLGTLLPEASSGSTKVKKGFRQLFREAGRLRLP